ncbi:MAG: VOC family protein [Gemmatimonadota bacterium]
MAALERVDHLVVAAPDLEQGVAWVEARLGARLLPGGRHPAWGTRNAVLPIGPSTYLEVIAPDPERSDPDLPSLFGIDRLREPGLVAWAAQGSDIEQTVSHLRERGVRLGEPRAGGRVRPDGSRLSWVLTDPAALDPDALLPFLIDWGESEHPAAFWDGQVRLMLLCAEHPDPPSLLSKLAALGLDMPVSRAPYASLVARLRCPAGEIELRRPADTGE